MNLFEVEDQSTVATSSPSKSSRVVYVLLVVTAVYIIFSLSLIFNTRSRLAASEAAQQASIANLAQHQASSGALAQRMGMTEQDLQQRMQTRAADLQRQQRGLAKRLQDQAEQQQQQLGQVNGEVADVRTELSGARTDIATTRTELASTNAKLNSAIGDLNGQSHLIARTRDELEELKHRGDRNYYEFTLYKGSRPTPVFTVTLQLKKVNSKKNKFTLNVIADDRTIEKKDRGVAEPLQFYTGRDHVLYEVVIWTTEGRHRVFEHAEVDEHHGLELDALSGLHWTWCKRRRLRRRAPPQPDVNWWRAFFF
ncbi:MAG: hypothetical protein ABSD13_17785 [Candidatus Korobacteraceae bacterium]